MVKYIHYGSDRYTPNMVYVCRQLRIDSKPDYGLWASRVDSEFGWKEWCEAEDYKMECFRTYFTFTLSRKAKILEIHQVEDIAPYMNPNSDSIFGGIDWTKVMSEYDGMEIFYCEDYSRFRESVFYSWDCDSIVIWNPVVVKPIEEKRNAS